MEEHDEHQNEAARAVLADTAFSVLDAARLAASVYETLAAELPETSDAMSVCHRVIQMGAEVYRQECCTLSFREAVEKSLQSRANRRQRTVAEIRQYSRRILNGYPTFADMAVRRITPECCRKVIDEVFTTPSTRRKARRLMHGVFAFCLRRGWCSFNPVAAIDVPVVREKPIQALSVKAVRHLLFMARRPEHRPCAAAVGLMLWAGIRPTELTRLHWADVRIAERCITIAAQHAKTGGARHVSIPNVLVKWLQQTSPYRLPAARIVPTSWVRRWSALRKAAGFEEWNPDTLRHTFASYHLAHFRNFSLLQLEMGHADINLLRTRYLNMSGVTAEGAAEFWSARIFSEERSGGKST